MITIEHLRPEHMTHVTTLLNTHVGAIVPGWAVPEPWLAEKLRRNAGENVVDPWVIERVTLVAIERQSVEAAVHVLRYGSGPEVNPPYHGVVEVDWLLAWPNAASAAAELLRAVAEQARAWGAKATWLGGGPPIGPFAGVPNVWPHIAAAAEAAGYRRDPGRIEAVYGGVLGDIAVPGAPPLPELHIRRSMGRWGTRFDALNGQHAVGYCEIVTDMTEGGALPSLRGWAELAEIEVEPAYRNRGIGSWLLCHAVAWARLGGCKRLLLITTAEGEAAGTGRLYRRFGWEPLARLAIGWSLG